MNEVKRVPVEESGVKDGVELNAKCDHVVFDNGKVLHNFGDCRMLASWENGTVSVSFDDDDAREMVIVRLDEMMVLLSEANLARREALEIKNEEGV